MDDGLLLEIINADKKHGNRQIVLVVGLLSLILKQGSSRAGQATSGSLMLKSRSGDWILVVDWITCTRGL